MKGLKYTLILLLFLPSFVFSQNFLGIANSNYAGTNANSLNPANVVDTRHLVFINLAGAGFDFQNNAARWKAPFSLIAFMTQKVGSEYKNTAGTKIIWKPSYLGITNAKAVNIFANGEGRGPAIAFDSKKYGLGLAVGVKYKLLTSITKSSAAVGQAIIEGTKSPNLNGRTVTDNALNLNSSFYNEFFFTIGKTILRDEDRMIKIGLTAKYLNSDMFYNIKANSFDFQITTDPTNFKRQIIKLPQTDGSMTSASNLQPFSASVFTDQMTQITGLGKGFGADLGIIYEYRPYFSGFTRNNNGKTFVDPTINKYLYKIGFSLIDFGYMKFSSPSNVKVSEIKSTNNQILPGTYNKLNGFDKLISTTETVYFVDNSLDKHDFMILLPAMSNITFDYNLSNNWYINTTWRQSLLSVKRRGPISYSGVSIIPRFEKKMVEVALPLSLDNSYKNLNIGFSFRYSGVYFGSDNVTGWINSFNPRGLSIYGGLFLPIYHKLPASKLKCFYVDKPVKNKRLKH